MSNVTWIFPIPTCEPLDYQQRENLKRQASGRLTDPNTTHWQKAQSLLRYVEAHYWRAREALQTRPRKFQRRVLGNRHLPGDKLDIDIYIQHWMDSQYKAKSTLITDYPQAWKIIEDYFGYKPETSPFYHQAIAHTWRPKR